MDYTQVIKRIRAVADDVLPRGVTVAVVSKGDPELLRLGRREGWHFPQTDQGVYAGFHPANSHAAIEHLEQLRGMGAEYLLFPAPAFWWLDTYAQLRRYLDGRYTRIHEDDACVIFKMADTTSWIGRLRNRWRSVESDSTQARHPRGTAMAPVDGDGGKAAISHRDASLVASLRGKGGPVAIHASRLTADWLLVAGPFSAAPESEVRLVRAGKPVSIDVKMFSAAVNGGAEGGTRTALLIHLQDHQRHEEGRVMGVEPLGQLEILAPDGTVACRAADLSESVVDLRALTLETGLAALPPRARTELLDFILAALGDRVDRRLSAKLVTLRATLRERLPECIIRRELPQGLALEAVLTPDHRAFYVKGWARDAESSIARLTLIAPEGCRVELLDRLYWHRRPDVDQFYAGFDGGLTSQNVGFIGYFELPSVSMAGTGWIIEMENAAGDQVEVAAAPVARDPLVVMKTVLQDLVHERLPSDVLRARHISPMVNRLLERLHRGVKVERVLQLGDAPREPDVSIVVPLYGRIDFLEHQLAQFAHDQDIRRTDLIYVLDSPELADALEDSAVQLFELYRIPFRVAFLTHNGGFAVANNAGASLARGRHLLLLNSDVLPDRPGWLGEMARFYDATPKIGALGPKLLYEDDSLQHAGLYFARAPGTGLWTNQHYFKGFHRDLPAASVARSVPAVTGACLMIDTELYRLFGGLRGMYVQGDYEDSDLCLRLLEAGYANWYLPAVELYHLEGQSYPGPARLFNAQYNAWLHTKSWDARIASVMGTSDALFTGGDAV